MKRDKRGLKLKLFTNRTHAVLVLSQSVLAVVQYKSKLCVGDCGVCLVAPHCDDIVQAVQGAISASIYAKFVIFAACLWLS